jgi:hypothetical protein
LINKSYIKVKSSWGHDIYNLFLTQSSKSNSIVILFPGADYSCDKPLLHYARKATLLSGCDVLSLEYGYFKTSNSFNSEFLENTIKETTEAIQIGLSNSYKKIYFISKSLGTVVAGEISKSIGYDKINNLFLTPTIHTIPHITKAKCTVVVGTNDKAFSKEHLDAIKEYSSVDLHIINDAVHSLEVDNDYIRSLEILRDITNLCVDFVCKNKS